MHTDVFAGVARATATANGMPQTRQAFVPQPVVDLSRAQLRAYIEGYDPVSSRPFMQEVIEALTGPLDAEDLTGLSFDRSAPRLLSPDSEEGSAATVSAELLDRLPADNTADRRARRGDAEGHEPRSR